MRGKKWFILLPSLVIIFLASSVGVTRSSFFDSETSTGNTFQVWASMQWLQTTKAHFDAGVLTNVDTSSSLGDVRLAATTTTIGRSANNKDAKTVEGAVYTQIDSYAIVPYDGVITSWTYHDAGVTSSDVRLEFLSGSGQTWTMRAKSDPVTLSPETNTFTVSIPVQAGWHLGIYTGSGKLKHNSSGGTIEGRARNSGDFNVGVTKSDFELSSGHLSLTAVLSSGYSSGTIASQVLDTGVAGARWNALFWDKTLETGTNITFEVRASNTSFAKDTPPATLPWISLGETSPVTSGLPSGRYMQWRATLTTSDTSKTPILHEVRVYY